MIHLLFEMTIKSEGMMTDKVLISSLAREGMKNGIKIGFYVSLVYDLASMGFVHIHHALEGRLATESKPSWCVYIKA